MQKPTKYLQEDSVIMNDSVARKKLLSNSKNKPVNKKTRWLKIMEDTFLSL